jgi:hypothetical protein
MENVVPVHPYLLPIRLSKPDIQIIMLRLRCDSCHWSTDDVGLVGLNAKNAFIVSSFSIFSFVVIVGSVVARA